MSGITNIGEYRIKEEKPLGKGSFGTVYKVCKIGETDVIYALKRIPLKGLSTKDKTYCQEEISWMQKLKHRNIIQFHDSFEIGDELNIVMEFCQGGSLRDYIQSGSIISERKSLEIMDQICVGLKFLHNQRIMHRDIKTGNIFLQGNIVKLGDLALLRLMENPALVGKITKKVGTLSYMSPEMIAGKPYGFETDVWSLGCCLYEIAMKQMPYPAKTEIEVERKIRTEQISFEGFPYNTKIRKLLEQMLEKDPTNRPTIDTVSQQIQACITNGEKVIELVEEVVREKEPNKEVSFKLDASCKRFMATFPSNRPKSTSSLDSLVEEAASLNISETEPTMSARQRRKKTKTKIVHIPVKVNENEYNMIRQADNLQQVLERDYLSDVELEKMFRFLESNMEEKEFLDKMKIVIGDEKFKGTRPFLISLWLFKSSLLRRNYKMVCMKADN